MEAIQKTSAEEIRQKYPLVTVGTLCYNTGKYVVESLECVKRQQYPNIQHIIIDDCSKDDSVQMVESWIKANNYECTFIKRRVNKGIHAGLNDIFSLATGNYIAFISDDLWTDTKLLEQVSCLESTGGNVGMVYGDCCTVDESGNIITPSLFAKRFGPGYIPPSGLIFREVVKSFFFYIQSCTINLELFKRLGYRFDDQIISEDWDWELMISRNYEVHGINKVFAKYRRVAGSVTDENWSDAKIHRVYRSQFLMVLKYYNHPLNSKEDNAAVLNQLKHLFWSLRTSKGTSHGEKVTFFFQIWRRSLSLKDSLYLAAFSLGLDTLLQHRK